MADMVEIDAHALVELSADIQRTADGFAIQVPQELAKYARFLRDDSRGIVWDYPPDSTSNYGAGGYGGGYEGRAAVADSIVAFARSPKEWNVRAGAEDLALAGLWELGNKNSSRDDRTFRHPVFGDRNNWVEQSKWPFFSMALKHIEPVMLTGFAKMVDTILERFLL